MVAARRVAKVATGLTLIIAASIAAGKPRLQTGPDAEVTYDGLHRVDKTVLDAAWVKPDLDLTGYDKVMLVSAGFELRAVDENGDRWRMGRGSNSSDSEFPISAENQGGRQRRRLRGTRRKLCDRGTLSARQDTICRAIYLKFGQRNRMIRP